MKRKTQSSGHLRGILRENCDKLARLANQFCFTESCQATKEKIFRFSEYANQSITDLSPRHHEGRSRDRHGTWCGLRWTLAASARCKPCRRERGSVRRSRVVLAPRPWRLSVPPMREWQRWQQRPFTGESTK